MEPNTTGVKTWQWVVTVIVIIVLIIIGVLVFGGKGSQAPTTNQTGLASSTDETTGAVNRISMTDQYPGNVVYLNSVQLEKPGWVVVQADNNGTPGAVIGSAHFDAGINPGKITLTKAMVDGSTYYAVIYTDDGKGTFNATTDQPLTDSIGNVVMHVFHATTAAGAGLKG
jgi:hypothetical protein